MKQAGAEVTYTCHDAASAAGIFDSVIIPVYEASHADVIPDPFYSAARFAARSGRHSATRSSREHTGGRALLRRYQTDSPTRRGTARSRLTS